MVRSTHTTAASIETSGGSSLASAGTATEDEKTSAGGGGDVNARPTLTPSTSRG